MKRFLVVLIVAVIVVVIWHWNRVPNQNRSRPRESSLTRLQFQNKDDRAHTIAKTEYGFIFVMEPSGSFLLADRGQSGELGSHNLVFKSDWPINDVMFESGIGLAVGDFGTIFKSIDDGRTWISETKFTDFDLSRITITDRANAIVAGRRVQSDTDGRLKTDIRVFSTLNGGRDWNTVFTISGGGIFFAERVDDQSILIGIDGNKIIRSDDGGKTWNAVSQEIVDVKSDQNGGTWGVGRAGNVMKSTDNGKTWKDVVELRVDSENTKWSGIDFDDSGNGVVVSENGAIATSADRGLTWSRLTESAPEPLRFAVVSNGYCYAEGASGSVYGFPVVGRR